MPDTAVDPRLGVGGNNPPEPIEAHRTHLRETYTDLTQRFAELMAMADRLPETMDDDWEGKITEAIKSCTKFSRNSEVTRMEANEPFRALIAATDGFFKAMSDKVDALKAKMASQYLTPYQQEKAAAEKRRREEEARQAREKAAAEERARREEAARLAEAKRKEDEARREAERVEQARREEKARAEAAAKAEIEKAERAKREARQRELDAKAAQDKEAAERAKAEKAAADQAIADAKAKRDREAAEAKEKAEREKREAAAEVERANAERREQQRIADEARDRAAASTQRANSTKKAAGASQADMSRTRTDLGAIASLRTIYEHEVTDHDLVPRQYTRVDDGLIAAAVRAATIDGKCTLKIPGVRIYPKTDSVVR